MSGGLKQQARILDDVQRGYFSNCLSPKAPTLASLLNEYAVADRQLNAETDGLTLDIADDIRALLMREYGLTKAQVAVLGEAL